MWKYEWSVYHQLAQLIGNIPYYCIWKLHDVESQTLLFSVWMPHSRIYPDTFQTDCMTRGVLFHSTGDRSFPPCPSPPPSETLQQKTISFWQSGFVILSNHLGCLQNFSRWQRLVDKCFVSQVISLSATVAILINWTYDRIRQDSDHCWLSGAGSSELTVQWFQKRAIPLCQNVCC